MNDIERPQITAKGRAVLIIDAALGNRMEDAVKVAEDLIEAGLLLTEDHAGLLYHDGYKDAATGAGWLATPVPDALADAGLPADWEPLSIRVARRLAEGARSIPLARRQERALEEAKTKNAKDVNDRRERIERKS